ATEQFRPNAQRAARMGQANPVAMADAGHFSQWIDDGLMPAEADHFGLHGRRGQALDFDYGPDGRRQPGHGGSPPLGANNAASHAGWHNRIELVQHRFHEKLTRATPP